MATPVSFRGLDAVRLDGPRGASLVVALQGAQAVSWVPPDGRERLYLSERAVRDGRTPIRGGIPVCFPQFAGLGPLPKHGFLRTTPWRVVAARSGPDYALVTLETTDTDATRTLWPHAFRTELTLMLEADRLDLELCVTNTGGVAFTFTGALHTYLQVADVGRVTIDGLQGCAYRDAANGDRILDEIPSTLTIQGEVDRVYRNVERPLRVATDEGSLIVGSQGFTDVVLWNPGAGKGDALADLPPGGWRRLLCVEAACADTPVSVAAGEEWYGRQSLVVA
ncbi:MAG: D-hexose-6-phosphate mutarotase [Chromatiales bacterium]|jgi:glucose-6-phosphate 1-epimerase|nr:D-hexose-6-phosphate mutarotase [Chromatiales bacterium]